MKNQPLKALMDFTEFFHWEYSAPRVIMEMKTLNFKA